VTQAKLPLSARDRLILAVDTTTVDEARRLIDELYEYVGVFKVGFELFLNCGPAVLDIFQEKQLKIFFDGKFHDIPNTVGKAAEAVARRGVAMFTVHASGGARMLEAAVKSSQAASQAAGFASPIVLGVTVLTSLSQQMLKDELNMALPLGEQVVALGKLCAQSGVSGLVASAQEVSSLRQALGPAMVLVTPGVRPKWAEANDQARVLTPAEALRGGADYLVIGRPILAALDRRDAARRIVAEMEEALAPA
jgi:orotidine-5'-phosphate decarboxylase